MNSLRITLIGYGRMGKAVENIAKSRDHVIHLILDSESEWLKNVDAFMQTDVAIDFSVPEIAVDNLYKCFDAGIPVVTGTTGWHDRFAEVKQFCLLKKQSLFFAPNFNLGMNMVFRLNQSLARMIRKTGYQIALRETHHIHKKDAPSGTALKLAEDIIRESGKYKGWVSANHPVDEYLSIESIRENEVHGTHEVLLHSGHDEIMLKHEAKNRDGFALGAVMAAEFLYGKRGIFTMDDMIESYLNNED